jgi:thiosulfate dehydrogenase [quinone] large subunit
MPGHKIAQNAFAIEGDSTMNVHKVRDIKGKIVTNPPLATLLFDDTRFAVVWLIIRVLLGWQWVQAGLHKLSDPAWMETGAALKGFWTNAVTTPTSGKPPITFDWYRSLIQGLLDSNSYVWFAKLVAVGEFVVGVALILGLFVGIAAFLGGFMNWNYIMVGTASTNPLLFVAAIVLVLAWKTAGYCGLDRFLLPRLGTPWGQRADNPAVADRLPAAVG